MNINKLLYCYTNPDGMTGIGEFAFDACCNLACIIYEGTESQWNAVSKGNREAYTVEYSPEK